VLVNAEKMIADKPNQVGLEERVNKRLSFFYFICICIVLTSPSYGEGEKLQQSRKENQFT